MYLKFQVQCYIRKYNAYGNNQNLIIFKYEQNYEHINPLAYPKSDSGAQAFVP